MKSIILILFIVGVICISAGYSKQNMHCPPSVVQYRYIPKTFNEEQSTQEPLISVYGSMFSNESPWEQTQGYAST